MAQQFLRRLHFPTYGNFCLILALKDLGIDVDACWEKGEAIATFDCNQNAEYERLQNFITNRYKVAVTA